MKTETSENINSYTPGTREEVRSLSLTLGKKSKLLADSEKSLVVVLEGWDASGKSGCAEKITKHMEKDTFRIVHTAAPNEKEKSFNYMKRFWDNIPPSGNVAVFDRSWYGRVMVERIERLCTETAWQRAYREISEFERFLTDNGTLLIKFWLDISEEVQLERFVRRAATPEKRYKITPDDWRNRAKRSEYEKAIDEMLLKTDSPYARWHVVPSNDKVFSRITVLQKIIELIDSAK